MSILRVHHWLWLAVLFGLVACTNYRVGTPISFTEIVPDRLTSDPLLPHYTDENPALFVLHPNERVQIAAFIPTPAEREQFLQAQLDDSVIIAAFQGIKGNSIAGIEIRAIYQDGADLYVHAFFRVPHPNELAAQYMGLSAYSIVRVDLADLNPVPPLLTVHLIDEVTQDEVLQQTIELTTTP